MTHLCFVNGTVVPTAEALIPVMDRGFLFGDGIYEVVITRRGRFLCLDRHLVRLRASAERIRLEVPYTDEELAGYVTQTAQQAGNEESYARIILTRGSGTAPNIDLDHAPKSPNLVILVRPLEPAPHELLTRGLGAWLVTTCRNDRRALDPAIKSGNYLNNILGLMEAKRQGADTALFLNPAGSLTEAPTANVWLVLDGRIVTPTLESGILAGITRGLLLELGRRDGLPMGEVELGEAELRRADEVFLSSTTMAVAPVTRLDGRDVGTGRPGEVALDLSRRYEEYADELVGG